MAQAGPGRDFKSYRAAATTNSYRVVAPDTALSAGFVRLIQIPTDTSLMLGVSQASATTDQAIPVQWHGFAYAAVGASVSAGSLLTFQTTTGYVIQASDTAIATASSGGQRSIGVALQNGSAQDAVIEIALNINNHLIRIT